MNTMQRLLLVWTCLAYRASTQNAQKTHAGARDEHRSLVAYLFATRPSLPSATMRASRTAAPSMQRKSARRFGNPMPMGESAQALRRGFAGPDPRRFQARGASSEILRRNTQTYPGGLASRYPSSQDFRRGYGSARDHGPNVQASGPGYRARGQSSFQQGSARQFTNRAYDNSYGGADSMSTSGYDNSHPYRRGFGSRDASWTPDRSSMRTYRYSNSDSYANYGTLQRGYGNSNFQGGYGANMGESNFYNSHQAAFTNSGSYAAKNQAGRRGYAGGNLDSYGVDRFQGGSSLAPHWASADAIFYGSDARNAAGYGYDNEGYFGGRRANEASRQSRRGYARLDPYRESAQPFAEERDSRGSPASRDPNAVILQGGALKTWSWGDAVERVEILLTSEGIPLNADVELWSEAGNTTKMRVHSQDGSIYPFSAILEMPMGAPNTIGIRNIGQVELPFAAYMIPNDVDMPGPDFRVNATTVQGGNSTIYPSKPNLHSVGVMLRTDGNPLNATIELNQGPRNSKQFIELSTNHDLHHPIFITIPTLGSSNDVKVLNAGPVEFPLNASIYPHIIENEFSAGPGYGEQQRYIDGQRELVA